MSLVLLAKHRSMQKWKEILSEADPNIEVEIWPDVASNERVQFVVCWNQPNNVLNLYPNLKAVSSLGAGVDHILNDKALPDGVPVCRVVSPSLVQQMKEYVLLAVLNYQRNMRPYFEQQKRGHWKVLPNKPATDFSIGIMGLGELGRPTALFLSQLGYTVNSWSASAKRMEGIQTFAGKDKLNNFLEQTNMLVCMLPLTASTKDILDLDTFKKLKKPAWLINVARGGHLVEEDLIYALDKEWLQGATLDVFSEEPLPESHPFWNRANITITPHISSMTMPEEVAPQIIDNYKRALSGMELLNKADREKGY